MAADDETPEIPEISQAALDCDVDALRELISRGVAIDYTEPYPNLTPLQLVCRGEADRIVPLEDRVACVRLLLARGASLDAGAPGNPGYQNLTPLMYAALRGHLKIVKMLLSAGADMLVYVWSAVAPSGSSRIAGSRTIAPWGITLAWTSTMARLRATSTMYPAGSGTSESLSEVPLLVEYAEEEQEPGAAHWPGAGG